MAIEKKDIEAKTQPEQKTSESVQDKQAESKEEKKEVKTEEEKPETKAEQKEAPKESTVVDYFAETRKDLPELKPGDIIRVSYRVIEGGKERIQVYEGTVIALKNSGISKTITVRKTSFGISVERIFPLNSKLIQKIEVKKHSKVRRAKLYYLRKLKGKAARLKELR
jgi:large subunit ribosomal protein L19